MNREELVGKISELKKKKGAIILVHNYQRPEIQDIADFVGDSLELSKKAAETDARMIVFCGVRFMAETAKILSPDKIVILPRREAGCSMVDMARVDDLLKMKKQYPDAKVVSYVNTSAEVKAESDVCCTSSNAVNVVRNINARRVIFVPDRNLASFCQRFVKDKEIIPWNGFCRVHERFTKEEVLLAKENMPDALLLVHPECIPSVIDVADKVVSTGGMVKLAKESNNKKFLIGTEEGILYRLKKENPDKEFYSAGPAKICRSMKLTNLEALYRALLNEQYKIELPDDIIKRAQKALQEMIKYV